jgi:hypothetical protein
MLRQYRLYDEREKLGFCPATLGLSCDWDIENVCLQCLLPAQKTWIQSREQRADSTAATDMTTADATPAKIVAPLTTAERAAERAYFFTLLLHCCYTVVTLLFYCCYTVVTLLLHLFRHVGRQESRQAKPAI